MFKHYLYNFQAYTINSESTHLLIFGVPKINLRQELKSLLQKYGKIKYLLVSPSYPSEEFTECFHVNFENLQSARKAKKSVDMRSFYGSVLHVCYAPELEICQETKEKLNQRRIYIKKCLFRIKRDNAFNKNNLTQNSKITNHQQLQTNNQTDNFSSNKTANMCQIICPVIPQPESHIMLYSQSLITTADKVGMYNLNNSNINDTSHDLSEASSSATLQLKRPLDTKEYVFKKKRKRKSTISINEAIKSATMKLNTLQNPTEKNSEGFANKRDVLELKNSDNLQVKCIPKKSISEDFANKSDVLELKTLNNPQVKSIPKKSTNKIIMRINTKLI